MPFPTFNDLQQFTADQAREIQQFVSYLFGWQSKEHKDDGSHGAVTADSVTVSGNVVSSGTGPDTFAGDVIADFGGGSEVAIGAPSTINGTALLAGLTKIGLVLIGGASSGYVLVKRAKASAFIGAGTYSLAIYDLAENTTNPMLMIAKDSAGSYSLIDGGSGATTVRVGSATRPILEFYSTNGYFERGRATAMGEWTTPTFSAGDFTANVGSWTVIAGNVSVYAYTLIGKTMFLMFDITSTNVTNASALRLAIPGGYTIAKTTYGFHRAGDAGAATVAGLYRANTGNAYLDLFPNASGGTWTVTAGNNTSCEGHAFFEVQ